MQQLQLGTKKIEKLDAFKEEKKVRDEELARMDGVEEQKIICQR